jgi:hypothetical protein
MEAWNSPSSCASIVAISLGVEREDAQTEWIYFCKRNNPV